MQVFVRDLEGRTLPVTVEPQEDVATLKSQLVGGEDATLTFAGRVLSDIDILAACGMEDGCTLSASMGLLGGGKKRKKKTYTKPKKIKHKRKKVKLAVLKYYKVDSNDKVTRLRRECPHELCGPGVFMGMHFNRYYCGRCHLTYLIKKGE
uniref:Ribosomal protein S27a n=1 Tax=Amphidinium carterae TaxID=2961 RepID=F8QQL1_AMPCA|nr:ribosomal protein S27a [Amphidinium carterae]